MGANNDRRARIAKAIEELRKITKKQDIAFLLSENSYWGQVDVVPTGYLGFDLSTMIGGIPRGRVIEIFGPEGSGKTSLALAIAKAFQGANGVIFYVDMEQSLNLDSVLSMGIDPDGIAVSQPDSGEEALESIRHLVLKDSVDLVILDSIAALGFRAEMEKDYGESSVGLSARILSSFFRTLSPMISRRRVTLVLINQLRQKIGVTYGDKETTPGGLAIRYYASMRIDVRRTSTDSYLESLIKEGRVLGGHTVSIRFVKNKFGISPNYSKLNLNLIYGQGFDPYSDLVEQALKHGVFSQSGSWIEAFGKKYQGKTSMIEAVREDREIFDKTRKLVVARFVEEMEKYRSPLPGGPLEEVEVDDAGGSYDGEEEGVE